MHEEHMLSDYMEQPEILKYCSRKPVLTYMSDPDLFSDNLFIYGLNDKNKCVAYTFLFYSLGSVIGSIEDEALEEALQKDSLTEVISVGVLKKSTFSKYFKSVYKYDFEESKKHILALCREISSDAIYLLDGIKDDEDMDRDAADIASLYAMAGACQRRKIGIDVTEFVESEEDVEESEVN